jgi:hypothetical protein
MCDFLVHMGCRYPAIGLWEDEEKRAKLLFMEFYMDFKHMVKPNCERD